MNCQLLLGHRQKNEFSMSYSQFSLKITTLPIKNPNEIEILCLQNCQIQKLDGIQAFINLRVLRLRNNNIREIQELHKIQCQESLVQLDLSGNDIEFFYQARFKQLKKIFPLLNQLNGVDYHCEKIKRKTKKMFKMSTVLKQIAKAGANMKKTLKVQRYVNSRFSKQQSTEKRNRSNHERTARNENEYDNEDSAIRIKGQYYYPRASQLSQIKPYPDEASFDKENQLANISLGSISNIPLAHSINHNQLTGKRKSCLLINTSHLNQSKTSKGHLPLTQPTATFATQRIRQAQSSFVFKRSKTRQIELENDDQSKSIIIKKSKVTDDTSDQEEMLNQPCQYIKSQKALIAEAHYYKVQALKVFSAFYLFTNCLLLK